MKGSPAVPGGSLQSKPTRVEHLRVFHRTGSFSLAVVVDGHSSQGGTPWTNLIPQWSARLRRAASFF